MTHDEEEYLRVEHDEDTSDPQVTLARRQKGKLWVEIDYVYVGYEYNHSSAHYLNEEAARRLHADLGRVIAMHDAATRS